MRCARVRLRVARKERSESFRRRFRAVFVLLGVAYDGETANRYGEVARANEMRPGIGRWFLFNFQLVEYFVMAHSICRRPNQIRLNLMVLEIRALPGSLLFSGLDLRGLEN